MIPRPTGEQLHTTHYPSQMSSIRQFMLAGATDWNTIGSDLDASLLKSFVDPFSYVVSCKWFPITISGGQEENVKFGFWDSGVKARKLSSLMNRKEFTLARPDIPGIVRGDWVGKSPFTSYHVQCIPWGIIPVDSADITADGVVVVRLIDYVTGLGTLAIYKRIAGQGETQYNEHGGLLNIAETQVGIDVRLSQLSYDITVPTSLTELVGGVASMAFSRSSFTTEAGRSITSPAAILLIVVSSKTEIVASITSLPIPSPGITAI